MRTAVVVAITSLLAAVGPEARAAVGEEIGADTRLSFVGPDSVPTYGPDGEGSIDVAFNPLAGEYFIVYAADEDLLGDDEFEIYGQRVHASGMPVGEPVRLSDMGPDGDTAYAAGRPVVAFNPMANEYLVAWAGDDGAEPLVDDEREVYTQRVSAAGVEVGTNDRRVSSMGPDGSTAYQGGSPAVAFNPVQDEYLVAWAGSDNADLAYDGGREIFIQRLAADGVEVGPDDLRISDASTDGDSAFASVPVVAVNPIENEYLVAWEAAADVVWETEIYVQRLDSAGSEIGTNDDRVSGVGPGGSGGLSAADPGTAFNPIRNEYLLTWSAADTTPPFDEYEHEIYIQRLDADGVQVGTDDRRISHMGADGAPLYNPWSPVVAFNAAQAEYLVAWYSDDGTTPLVDDEFEVFVQRLDMSGAELGTDDQRISDAGLDGNPTYGAFLPAVAFNSADGEFLVTWYGDDDSGSLADGELEVFGQRYDAGAALPNLHAGGPYTTSLGVAVPVAGTLTGDLSTVAGTAWSAPGCTFEAPTQLVTHASCAHLGPHVLTLTATLASGYTLRNDVALRVELCPQTPPPTPFTDIAPSFARDQIACLYNAGIVAGTGAAQYSPAAAVTREQMAVFLMTAYETATGGAYAGPAPDGFADIAGSFAEDRIRQLAGLGVTAGTAPGIYSPTTAVTRDQMAVFLVRLYSAITGAPPGAGGNPFTDIAGNFAEQSIVQLVQLGVTAGTSATTYSPGAVVTREQMAVFVVNLVGVAT